MLLWLAFREIILNIVWLFEIKQEMIHHNFFEWKMLKRAEYRIDESHCKKISFPALLVILILVRTQKSISDVLSSVKPLYFYKLKKVFWCLYSRLEKFMFLNHSDFLILPWKIFFFHIFWFFSKKIKEFFNTKTIFQKVIIWKKGSDWNFSEQNLAKYYEEIHPKNGGGRPPQSFFRISDIVRCLFNLQNFSSGESWGESQNFFVTIQETQELKKIVGELAIRKKIILGRDFSNGEKIRFFFNFLNKN